MNNNTPTAVTAPEQAPWGRWAVLVAVAIGVTLGHFYPQLGADMKPLGDAFIKLIKMIIAPIIFCTVVLGIAGIARALSPEAVQSLVRNDYMFRPKLIWRGQSNCASRATCVTPPRTPR